MKKFYSLLFVLFAFTACKDEKSASSPAPSPTVVVTPTSSVSITSTPSIVVPGAAATLTWSGTLIADASCKVEGSDGKTFTFGNRTATVNPTTATTYTVTCTQSSDNKTISATDSVSITMDTGSTNLPNSNPVMTIPTVSANPGIIITVNGQNSVTVAPGTNVAFAYAVQGVAQNTCNLTINPQGAVPQLTNNPSLVAPTVTTTYTMNCPNPLGGTPLTSVATINISTSAIGSTGTGGGTLTNCAGAQSGGFCWYLSTTNQSCNQVCAAHGGVTNYEAYAGSAGTDANCTTVLGLLGVNGGAAATSTTFCSSGWGCYALNDNSKGRCPNMQVTSEVASPIARLACSCAQ